MKICVFHLVWAPLGIDYFDRFLESYRSNSAGIPHRLHILFNGFASEDEIEPFRQILRGIDYDSTTFDKPIQDVVAYIKAASIVQSNYVCFLNSYAVILASGWLDKLYSHAVRDSVGLVGATGSNESHFTNALQGYRKIRLQLGRNIFRWPQRYERFLKHRACVRKRVEYTKANFQPWPNPHLRTNAFMVKRDLFLKMRFGEIRSKEEAYLFESGKHSLSRQVMELGLDVLLVGSDGKGYGFDDWHRSRTFRSGDQSNLLVSDNQTDIYSAATTDERQILSHASWYSSL